MADRARFYVGTSGWQYGWSLYEGVPASEHLTHYATVFDAVEINATFYRMQRPATVHHWLEATPARFCFAIKASRYLTHTKRLKELPARSLRMERARAAAFGDRLRVTLWQLPASFHRDDERLQRLLDALDAWPAGRHALEARHPSWMVPEVEDALRAHGVAPVLSDAPTWPLWDAPGEELVYLRLHGHTRLYCSRYGGPSLDRWAERIAGWLGEGREVHAYFDNTDEGAAPKDAQRLRERVRARLR